MALPARTTQSRQSPARWEPFRDLEEMRDRMERLMQGFWRDWPDGEDVAWSPSADIEETDDAWIVKAELPGVKRDDVNIEVNGQELRIFGELNEDKQREGTLRRRMRRMGSFEYRTTLPAAVDADQIDASLDHGVLTVRLPKPAQSQSHRVEIKGD